MSCSKSQPYNRNSNAYANSPLRHKHFSLNSPNNPCNEHRLSRERNESDSTETRRVNCLLYLNGDSSWPMNLQRRKGSLSSCRDERHSLTMTTNQHAPHQHTFPV